MKWKYTLDDNNLRIEDANTNELVWTGKPDGHAVKEILPLRDGDDCILLLDFFDKASRLNNIIRIKPDGSVLWRAELPKSDGFDAYTSVKWNNEDLEAYSWSGFVIVLSIKSGRVLSSFFVK